MSDNIMAFTVLGKPQAKERPRFNQKTGTVYTPQRTVSYKETIQMTYKQQHKGVEPFAKGVPLVVTIETYHKIPKKTSKAAREKMEQKGLCPTTKPDVDNVVKAILDALNGIAYHDDSQVVELKVSKYYSGNERVWVQIKKKEEVWV